MEEHLRFATEQVFGKLFVGLIDEPIDPASTRSISVQNYGLSNHRALYTSRQFVGIGTLCSAIRDCRAVLHEASFADDWTDAIQGALTYALDKLVEH